MTKEQSPQPQNQPKAVEYSRTTAEPDLIQQAKIDFGKRLLDLAGQPDFFDKPADPFEKAIKVEDKPNEQQQLDALSRSLKFKR